MADGVTLHAIIHHLLHRLSCPDSTLPDKISLNGLRTAIYLARRASHSLTTHCVTLPSWLLLLKRAEYLHHCLKCNQHVSACSFGDDGQWLSIFPQNSARCESLSHLNTIIGGMKMDYVCSYCASVCDSCKKRVCNRCIDKHKEQCYQDPYSYMAPYQPSRGGDLSTYMRSRHNNTTTFYKPVHNRMD